MCRTSIQLSLTVTVCVIICTAYLLPSFYSELICIFGSKVYLLQETQNCIICIQCNTLYFNLSILSIYILVLYSICLTLFLFLYLSTIAISQLNRFFQYIIYILFTIYLSFFALEIMNRIFNLLQAHHNPLQVNIDLILVNITVVQSCEFLKAENFEASPKLLKLQLTTSWGRGAVGETPSKQAIVSHILS